MKIKVFLDGYHPTPVGNILVEKIDQRVELLRSVEIEQFSLDYDLAVKTRNGFLLVK